MKTVTLEHLKRNGFFVEKLFGSIEVNFKHLLDNVGVEDTLWIIDNCVIMPEQQKINMCTDFAESVLHIWENWAKDNAKEHLEAPRNVINALRNLGLEGESGSLDEALRNYKILERLTTEGEVEVLVENVWAAVGVAQDAGNLAVAKAAGVVACKIYVYVHDAAWIAENARNVYVGDDDAIDKEREKQKEIILKYFG
jgi:hypothetical protein